MYFSNLILDLLGLYFWTFYFVFLISVYESILQNYFFFFFWSVFLKWYIKSQYKNLQESHKF